PLPPVPWFGERHPIAVQGYAPGPRPKGPLPLLPSGGTLRRASTATQTLHAVRVPAHRSDIGQCRPALLAAIHMMASYPLVVPSLSTRSRNCFKHRYLLFLV